jgi:serine phosphatase RsbU (regulator of sigma subunit)
MMLKLRDFLHLPQLDALIDQLIQDGPGLILLAGIDSRAPGTARAYPPAAPAADTPRAASLETIPASGLSALFSILIQEILLARPQANAIVVAQERELARVPRQLKRRVGLFPVEGELTYPHQIELARKQRPGLLVIDHLTEENAPYIFRAAASGLRVLTQYDTVLRGAAIAQEMLNLNISREQVTHLRWILTAQRMQALCPHCKESLAVSADLTGRLIRRYPHLQAILEKIARVEPPENPRLVTRATGGFFRATGCERCRGSGYQGDLAVFDLFRNDPGAGAAFDQASLLSLEEYALHLAAEGQLALEDLLNLETNHLRRTYQMLTASERALTTANSALSRKLLELQASNRVLLQRTEVLMSLEDLGKALISSSSLKELAARVCRRASDLTGANRIVLYLRRILNVETPDGQPSGPAQETAEILAVHGWEVPPGGQIVPPAQVFGAENQAKVTHFLKTPPGVQPPAAKPGAENSAPTLANGLRVPLFAQEQLVGVMIVQCTQKEAFSPGETALLQTFANQAALGIQRAGLVEDLRAKITQLQAAQAGLVKKERIERELELAHQVQQAMLPHSFPVIPGFTIAAQNEPARQVGGDFYDLFRLDDDHFGIVIADVADKGMPAALYMALARSLLLAEARRERSPRQALLNVNRLLLELGELNGFVSVFYGVVDQVSRRLVYTRAGHERPLLLHAGQVEQLSGEGAVLGILESPDLHLNQEETLLQPGDCLVLFTDGLTDVANPQGAFFGLARLVELVTAQQGRSAGEICQQLFNHLAQYRGEAEQFDDMTLLVIEVQAP